MPKTPIYKPGSVRPSPTPGVRFAAGATGASFGGVEAQQMGQVGEALDQVAAMAAKIAKANQKTVDDTKSEDNFNQYDKAMEAEFKRDYELRRGEEAAHLDVYVKEKEGELKKKFMENLDNDRQRELFEGASGRASVGYHVRALKHEQREVVAYREVVSRQSINQGMENAVSNRKDMALLTVALSRAEAKIREKVPTLREYEGMGKARVDAGVAKNIDVLYSGVLAGYIADKNPLSAWSFYRENEDKFSDASPKREAWLKGMVETKAIDNEAARHRDSGLGLGERLEEARDIVEVSQETELPISSEGAERLYRLIKSGYGEEVGLRKIEAQRRIDNAYKTYTAEFQLDAGKDGPYFDPEHAEAKIKQVQAIEFPVDLQGSARTKLEHLKKNFIDTTMWKLGKGAKPKASTDEIQLLELWAMEPEELNKMDRSSWRLDGGDFNAVLNYSQGVTSGKGAFNIQSRAKYILDLMEVDSGEFDNDTVEGINNRAKMAGWLRREIKHLPPGDAFDQEEVNKLYSKGTQFVSVRKPRPRDDTGELTGLRGNFLDFATIPRTVKVMRYKLDPLVREGVRITLDNVPEKLKGIEGLRTHGKVFYADITVQGKGPVRRVWDLDGVVLRDNKQPEIEDIGDIKTRWGEEAMETGGGR